MPQLSSPPLELPAALQALGLSQEYRPLSLIASFILASGEPSTGKSTLAAGFPHSLGIDVENKWANIPRKRAYWYPGPSKTLVPYAQLEKVTATLEQEAWRVPDPQERVIRHVSFDTLDMIQSLCHAQLLREYHAKDPSEILGGRGGWDMINKRTLSFPLRLYRAGYGVLVICHTHQKTVTVNKVTSEVTRLSVTPGVNDGLKQLGHLRLEFSKQLKREQKQETRDGKTLSVLGPPRMVVTVKTQQEPGDRHNVPLGTQIPLPAAFILPERDGFEHLSKLYETAQKQAAA